MVKKPKEYLESSWINPKLTIGNSTIDGIGIIAKNRIKRNEKIMEWGGQIVSKSTFDEKKFHIQSAIPIDDEYYLAAPIEQKTKIDEYLNHSCDPNTWLVDEVTVVAKRDIEKGEEITLDSATWDTDDEWSYANNGICKCQSKNCRKKITANDYKIKFLQKKYKNHFSPYIQAKINSVKI